MIIWPPRFAMPPPLPDLFPQNVLLTTLTAPVELHRPPPYWLKLSSFVFPATMQLLIASEPPVLLMPAPRPVIRPFDTVRPETMDVTLLNENRSEEHTLNSSHLG